MNAVFVTATGTDIGKTFVVAGLIRHLRALGYHVDAIKPVVTGFDATKPATSDPGLLLAALGKPATDLDRIAPYRFAAPLSPDMAASQENRAVDLDALIGFCRSAIATHTGTLLIEGIGGVMVPLDARHTVLDWIATLRVPALLVTGSYLGSLSHTLTAFDALRRRDIGVIALVVNETPGSTVALDDTVATLAHFTALVPIVTLPRLAAGATTHTAFAEIASLL